MTALTHNLNMLEHQILSIFLSFNGIREVSLYPLK